MACYIINYDLRKVKDYDSLIGAIKAYGTWAKILKSCWAVVTNSSAEKLRDDLLKHMDADDGIFVIKSGVEAAWRKVECEGSWLQKNL